MVERVVVTGMGTVNSIGLSVAETWQSALNGNSGVGPITLFNTDGFLVKIACEVKGFNPDDHMLAREARRRDRFAQLATAAAREAIQQSGIVVTDANAGRIGVIVSAAIGGIGSLENTFNTLMLEGPRRVSPFSIPMLMPNGASGMIAIDYGIKGPCFSVASACASGADGIGMAWMLIRSGVIDVAIAGAADATITPMGVSSFDRLGAMSRQNDDYSMVPQPFDNNRDGLVMGEGSAILVLESESHARMRGAEILGELAGYASTADAFHITAPSEDGIGGAQAIRQALATASVNLEEVNYINAHGTATPLNDLSETLAIKAAFGSQAYHVPISSTKSMTGHMMGTTGALEAIFCILATRQGVIPPTIHYQTPDPLCDLDYVPNQARQMPVRVCISNAFGFGGHNAVLVIRKFP